MNMEEEEESQTFRYVFTVEGSREGPVTDWFIDVSEFDGVKNRREMEQLIAVQERLEPGSSTNTNAKMNALAHMELRSRYTTFGGVYAVSSSTELTREDVDKVLYRKLVMRELDGWLEGAKI